MNVRYYLDNIQGKKVIGHSLTVALEGAYSFSVGGMIGSFGEIGTIGKVLSKEWTTKFVLSQEFSFPFNYLLNKFRWEIWR